MKPSEDIRSISYLKTHAAELIRELEAKQGTVIITQHGEAKAVLQDVKAYEQMCESLAMLKLLALSRQDIDAGRVAPLDEAFRRVRRRVKARRGK